MAGVSAGANSLTPLGRTYPDAARDTESDTESLVFGGKSCKLWKLQPTERSWPLS